MVSGEMVAVTVPRRSKTTHDRPLTISLLTHYNPLILPLIVTQVPRRLASSSGRRSNASSPPLQPGADKKAE